MFGDQVRKSGKDPTSLTRLKARLEVVTESVGEASGEWTDRAGLARLPGPRKSSFVVEKIDYHPTDDDGSSADRSASASRPAPHRRLLNSPPPLFAALGPSDGRSANAFTTPHKRDVLPVDAAFLSPREGSGGGKSGFFSVRKKTAPVVRERIQLRIDSAGSQRHEYHIELPGEALGPWVVSSGGKEARDTATTAAGGPTPTNSGGKIRIVNNIFQNTILQGVGKSQPTSVLCEPPAQVATHRPKSRPKLDTTGPIAAKSSAKRKMNLSVDHRDCKPVHQPLHTGTTAGRVDRPGLVDAGFVSPKHKADAKLFSFSGCTVPTTHHTASFGRRKGDKARPLSDVDESLLKTTASRPKEVETSGCFSRRSAHSAAGGAVLLSGVELAQYEKMKKFHSRLTKLMRDTGVEEGAGEEVGLGEAWRFVKKVVVGYVDAKTQLKQLQKCMGEAKK